MAAFPSVLAVAPWVAARQALCSYNIGYLIFNVQLKDIPGEAKEMSLISIFKNLTKANLKIQIYFLIIHLAFQGHFLEIFVPLEPKHVPPPQFLGSFFPKRILSKYVALA